MSFISTAPAQATHQNKASVHFIITRERLEPLLVFITALAIAISLGLEASGASEHLILPVNIISYLAGGYYGVIESLNSLKRREINVDLLMVLAAGGAALVNQWHEGAILLFLFSLSNVLQAYALDRSRRAIQSLLNLRPDTATVRHGDTTITVAVEDLKPGDVVVLQPGELVPIDGRVLKGSSTVNQASITGESIPVLKQIGDEVFAATLNENGALDIEVTRPSSESTLARIIKLVEEAQDNRAETQRFLDTFEQYYAMVVIAFTLLLITIPPMVSNITFSTNFYRAMVVLVVASPCALIISTPASILSAIANGARRGILFKGGAHLETMAHIKAVALDKTGTLTTGEPGVTDIITLNRIDEADLLQLVASVESRSEHPLAQSIVRAAQKRQLAIEEPTEFKAIPGRGLEALYKEQMVFIGSRRLIEEQGIDIPNTVVAKQTELENQGKTVLYVYRGHLLGLIGLADTARPEAIALVQALHKVGVEKVVMLTGDNARAAAAIAQATGIDEYCADLMPEDKVAKLKALRAKYGSIAMVGDGVNDAPALATATIGIAMGAAGTDVALETADVVLMSSELSKIPYAIALSKRAQRVVWQNIIFSLSVIAVLVTAALLPIIELPLPIGVVGHEGSTLVVVANGLRLLVFKPS